MLLPDVGWSKDTVVQLARTPLDLQDTLTTKARDPIDPMWIDLHTCKANLSPLDLPLARDSVDRSILTREVLQKYSFAESAELQHMLTAEPNQWRQLPTAT